MTRRNALLRLHDDLLARKAGLCSKLASDLANLHDFRPADANGDGADLAFEANGDEISSRLAELKDRELVKIERALERFKQDLFGICECCQKPILLARLNALPHTAFCIHCEREMEGRPARLAQRGNGNWDQVSDAQAPMQDQKFDLAELETQIPGERSF